MKNITCLLVFCFFQQAYANLKILHLTFHKGCEKEIEYVCKKLNYELETWYMHDLPLERFDGVTTHSDRYKIDSVNSKEIWKRNVDRFNQFDLIITSDTAPLSRIFLQNDCKIPLIIWVCNRFDYAVDNFTNESERESYYELIRSVKNRPNVEIISYTAFEHVYAKKWRNVDVWQKTIKPIGQSECFDLEISLIPEHIDKSKTLFIPSYHNDTLLLNLEEKVNSLGIPAYRGRYNGPPDLKSFKGIIHIPYAWSNLALFENWSNGLVYFIPTPKFLAKLSREGDFFWSPPYREKDLLISEWYNKEHRANFVYFNSWRDLVNKIKRTNYQAKSKKILNFHANHKEKTLSEWKYQIEKLAY